MTKITKSKDCGNSPKNVFSQEFAINLMAGRIEQLQRQMSDDVEWALSSEKTLQGAEDIIKAIEKTGPPSQVTILQVLSHGKLGAVTGDYSNRKVKKKSFCLVIEFSSASAKSVRRITTYEA